MNIGLAFKLFIAVLTNKIKPDKVQEIFSEKPEPVKQKIPLRSEAITLLSVLQREARLIDFIKENIDSYQDSQIGAAVRDIHRNCAKTLDRIFSIEKLVSGDEGTKIEVPAGFTSETYRLTGSVAGEPPYSGILQHTGWKVSKCDLPEWQGDTDNSMVIAPAEVEI